MLGNSPSAIVGSSSSIRTAATDTETETETDSRSPGVKQMMLRR